MRIQGFMGGLVLLSGVAFGDGQSTVIGRANDLVNSYFDAYYEFEELEPSDWPEELIRFKDQASPQEESPLPPRETSEDDIAALKASLCGEDQNKAAIMIIRSFEGSDEPLTPEQVYEQELALEELRSSLCEGHYEKALAIIRALEEESH